MDPTAVLVAAIGSVASIAAAIITARTASRSARSAESTALKQIEAGAYARARESYESTLAMLRAEIDRQSRQITKLQRQVDRLTRQVRAAGLVPAITSEEDVP